MSDHVEKDTIPPLSPWESLQKYHKLLQHLAASVTCDTTSCMLYMNTARAMAAELHLAEFVNSIPGGVAAAQLKNGIHVLFANEEFYNQTEFTKEEFYSGECRGNYDRLIDDQDRDGLLESFRSFLVSPVRCTSFDYRIRTRTGHRRWMRAHISPSTLTVREEKLIQCILFDITQEREHAIQNMLNEQRFRIISEQTKDVVFDWDLNKDTVLYSPVFEKMFGYPAPVQASIEQLLGSDLFLAEDIPVLRQLIFQMRAGIPYIECNVRMKRSDNTYFWTLHRTTAIYDEEYHSTHIVGIISDIDKMKRMTLELQHRAEHDVLTGLLNRSSANYLMEQRLSSAAAENLQVFLLLDIDRFKQVNDTLGHIAGDLAIQQIADQIKMCFRTNDILCRLGGDEFSILLVNIPSREIIVKKLKLLLNAIHTEFHYEEKIHMLSVSIGIAVCPEHGNTLSDLYRKADKALYKAKSKGGNRFEFYPRHPVPSASRAMEPVQKIEGAI